MTVVLLAGSVAGCAGRGRQLYAFPQTWPGSGPLGPEAPTLLLEPIRREQPPAEAPGEPAGLPSDAVLSALLMKHLQVSGVNAMLEPQTGHRPEYVLQCDVPQLGYDIGAGFPKAARYRAELACTVREAQSQAVIWQRSLSQAYDRTQVWNLLAHLAPRPHDHERVLFQECIVPLWDTMASSVSAVLASRRAFPPVPRASVPSAIQ